MTETTGQIQVMSQEYRRRCQWEQKVCLIWSGMWKKKVHFTGFSNALVRSSGKKLPFIALKTQSKVSKRWYLYFDVCCRTSTSQLVLWAHFHKDNASDERKCQPRLRVGGTRRNEMFRHHWHYNVGVHFSLFLLQYRTSDQSFSSPTNRRIYGLVLHQILAVLYSKREFWCIVFPPACSIFRDINITTGAYVYSLSTLLTSAHYFNANLSTSTTYRKHNDLSINLLYPFPPSACCSPLLGINVTLLLNPPTQRNASQGQELVHEQAIR